MTDPQIVIPEITTKATTAVVIENYLTEEDYKTTDTYGAPPLLPDEI